MKKIVVMLLICCMACYFSACAKVCETCNQTGTVDCSHCLNGSSTSECWACFGRAYSECAECSGTGYNSIRTNYDCERCSDSKKPGYIYNSGAAIGDLYNGTMSNYNDAKYWQICGNCHAKCRTCNGSGNGIKCLKCDGTGKAKCGHCGGRKVVTCPDCK
jgi:hypothetical protein